MVLRDARRGKINCYVGINFLMYTNPLRPSSSGFVEALLHAWNTQAAIHLNFNEPFGWIEDDN